MQKENENYLTIKEIAEMTKLSQSKLYTVIHYDRLKSELIGGRVVIKRENFEDWQRQNLKPKEKEAGKKEVKKEKVEKKTDNKEKEEKK